MTEQDQVAALAELDGREIAYGEFVDIRQRESDGEPEIIGHSPFPDYPNSFDAIIPLVKKCWEAGLFAPEKFYQAIPNYYPHILTFIQHTTPKELCEALLRATGKWKE